VRNEPRLGFSIQLDFSFYLRFLLLNHPLGPIVRFLREQANELGHDIPPSRVRCRPCRNLPFLGGFDPDYGITLCSDQLAFDGRRKLEDTLAHEMIHAYDYLRFNIDRKNMAHQACTEVRAATLSGECRFVNEFWRRGQHKVTRQFQECIKRRATLSLMGRSEIAGKEEAEGWVDKVWENCFTDTRPFDEVFK
jgi:inner membrane protease ATP23